MVPEDEPESDEEDVNSVYATRKAIENIRATGGAAWDALIVLIAEGRVKSSLEDGREANVFLRGGEVYYESIREADPGPDRG